MYFHHDFGDSDVHGGRPVPAPDLKAETTVGIHCALFDKAVGVCPFVGDDVVEVVGLERLLE